MRIGKPGTVASADLAAPSRAAGELAGILFEIQSLSPDHLKRIELRITEFHAAREASEQEKHEAQTRIEAADTARTELADRSRKHNARVNTDLENVRRQGETLTRRETEVTAREENVTTRENIVANAERRLARVRETLDPEAA